jgi:hypothetical protein
MCHYSAPNGLVRQQSGAAAPARRRLSNACPALTRFPLPTPSSSSRSETTPWATFEKPPLDPADFRFDRIVSCEAASTLMGATSRLCACALSAGARTVERMRERDQWMWTCYWSSSAGRPILVVNEWFAGSFLACVRRCIVTNPKACRTEKLTEASIDRPTDEIAGLSASVEDEQTLADQDQSLADGDQSASDSDQTAADSDQTAADQDQIASDHDLVHGGDPELHHWTRGIRDHAALLRQEAAQDRAGTAAARDLGAEARDAAAEELARQRDAQLDARDASWVVTDGLAQPSAEVLARAEAKLRRAARDRSAAAAGRADAAADRAQAATDRARAADDRVRAHMDRDLLIAVLRGDS